MSILELNEGLAGKLLIHEGDADIVEAGCRAICLWRISAPRWQREE
jgi:hypothetical protein